MDDRNRASATLLLPMRGQRAEPERVERTESGRRRAESAAPIELGQVHQIGRFELIRELARGGMGQIYLGRDTKLGRRVAIKFLLRGDAHFVQRFLVEAHATARCTHENIVTIYEVGEHDGLPYMVLEYLEGKTLQHVLESRPAVRQFVELMVPVMRALERAHAYGIVHRDLKPSNVFVTERGQVKVLDFGVARLVEPSERVIERATMTMPAVVPSAEFTTASSIVGTMPYMSPEQWGADEVDPLCDIFAFGMMFWRAFAGVHPAGTNVPEQLRARLTDLDRPLPSIGDRVPELPRELVAIVDRCLALHKRDRYQRAADVVADLEAFLQPSVASSDACPFRGLSAFAEDDARYFFGRANEIRTARAQLEAWPLLAVVGPSGVGKSSFIHAGLVPAIRAAGGSWRVVALRPGRAPLQRLAASLAELLADGELADDLVTQLREAPGLFGATLRAGAARRQARVIIVVDQLEELFTLCDDEAERRAFATALLAAADDPSSPARVIASMRADFLDRLAAMDELAAVLSRSLFLLSTPDRVNLRDTLVRPAELAGYAFEDEAMIDDMMQVATSRGALPLLSFAATRLWDARDRERKLFPVAAYHEMGGVGGAFARHADQVAAAIPTPDHKLLRAILTRLVTPEGTRAVVTHDELATLADDRRQVDRILDHLVRARLVHIQTDPDQPATIEIVHEMLVTEWPMLRRWLEDSHAVRAFVAELRQAARQWASRGRPADLVWRGATAQDALGHARRQVLELSALEREFLDAIAREAGRARRRRVFAFAAIFAALALVIGGGAIALWRISSAEAVATEKAGELQRALTQARKLRDDAEHANTALERERDTLAAEQRQREAAEQAAKDASQTAKDATQAESLTKDQLIKVNDELRRQIHEAQVATTKARAAEAAATQAEQAVQRMLAKERDERAKLQERLKAIDERKLE